MKNSLFLFMVLIGVISCKNENQTIAKENVSGKKSETFNALFKGLHQKGMFNGNVLVAEKGTIIFEAAYGVANEMTKEKINEETIFELASVSKQFTAMGVVQLEKTGNLAYSDLISKYIPELDYYQGITIKHLLLHTGGLPDYMDLAEKEWDKSAIATNEDIIYLFQTFRPKKRFEPNEKWEYSNTGYLLLATIIERVSGKSFEVYLKEKIFDKLNMNHTSVYRRRFEPKPIKNYAQGYIYSDSLAQKILPDELGKDFYVVYLDGIVGDGMVNSNLHDLLKWDRALYTNDLINDADRKLIFSSYKTGNNSETDYGFGWMVDSSKKYGSIVSHTGGWAGYLSYIERDLDNDKTIIILQNNLTPQSKIPIKNTRRILYNEEVEQRIKLDNRVLELYAGKYLDDKKREKEILWNEK